MQIYSLYSINLAVWFLCMSSVQADDDIGLCCLCGDCTPPVRLGEFVDEKGTTCQLLANLMADPTNHSRKGNSECQRLQGLHYDRCCNPDHDPLPIAQTQSSSDPGDSYPKGSHPPCELCRGGQLPVHTTTKVAVLGLHHPAKPELTCLDLHWLSLRGHIEERVCRPMQNYFQEPCGCVEPKAFSLTTDAPTGAPTLVPKKVVSNDSKGDTSKMHNHRYQRGKIHRRQRQVKGGQSNHLRHRG